MLKTYGPESKKPLGQTNSGSEWCSLHNVNACPTFECTGIGDNDFDWFESATSSNARGYVCC